MSRGNRSLLAGIVGLAAGTAAAGSTYLIRRRWRTGEPDRAAGRLELAVVDALCEDEVAGACPIDVAALGPGLVELSGRVPDAEASSRAAEVAQRVPGVHTVVNRLAVEVVEQQLAQTRRRYQQGDPELHATRRDGTGSGMGARRQGPETDPARPDDSQGMVEDALGLDGPAR